MALSSAQVLAYLDEHAVRKHTGDFESLLEMLHYIYTASILIDNQDIHRSLQPVDAILRQLPPTQADDLFGAVSDLCLAYEQAAFNHGILVGMLLMTELNGLP